MPTKESRFHGEVTEKSHKNMSRIRGKYTSIEVMLRKENEMSEELMNVVDVERVFSDISTMIYTVKMKL